MSGGCAHGLAYAAITAVVAVGGHGCALFLHLDDPAQAVVGEGKGSVCGHVAIDVIGLGLRGSAGGSGQLACGVAGIGVV